MFINRSGSWLRALWSISTLYIVTGGVSFQLPAPPPSWETVGVITILVIGYVTMGGLLLAQKIRFGDQVDKQITALNDAHDKEITALNNGHDRELKALTTGYETQVKDKDGLITRLLTERDGVSSKREGDLDRFERMTVVLENAVKVVQELARNRNEK